MASLSLSCSHTRCLSRSLSLSVLTHGWGYCLWKKVKDKIPKTKSLKTKSLNKKVKWQIEIAIYESLRIMDYGLSSQVAKVMLGVKRAVAI